MFVMMVVVSKRSEESLMIVIGAMVGWGFRSRKKENGIGLGFRCKLFLYLYWLQVTHVPDPTTRVHASNGKAVEVYLSDASSF